MNEEPTHNREREHIGPSFLDYIKKQLKDPNFHAGFIESRTNRRIATNVARLRTAQGMTQAELAEQVDSTESEISRLENYDDRTPPLYLLRKIAVVLDAELIMSLVSRRVGIPEGEQHYIQSLTDLLLDRNKEVIPETIRAELESVIYGTVNEIVSAYLRRMEIEK